MSEFLYINNKDIMAPRVSNISIQKWAILHSNDRGIKAKENIIILNFIVFNLLLIIVVKIVEIDTNFCVFVFLNVIVTLQLKNGSLSYFILVYHYT